jgi:hypothetical protein
MCLETNCKKGILGPIGATRMWTEYQMIQFIVSLLGVVRYDGYTSKPLSLRAAC